LPAYNIVVVMTDQQRADFLRGQGFALDTMPFLEQLAQRGVWFDAAYTPMPICMPARVSMLTGRYAKAHGMIANWSPIEARYSQDLPEVLRQQGYELALFGKNHSHCTADRFDVWQEYSHTSGAVRPDEADDDVAFDRWMESLGHWISHEPAPFPLASQYPVRIVSDFVQWLDGRQERRPFFAWVSFPEPHSPYQVPDPYFDLFPADQVPPPSVGPEALASRNFQWQYQYQAIKHYHPECDSVWGRYRANYCGMLRLIDDQLRRVVETLEAKGLLQDTVVVYLSDHGEFCGDYGLYRKGLALPQCTIRVPMLWFGGPVRPHAGSHPAHVSLVDLFPTVCEAVGAPIPPGVQGRSLWPLLRLLRELCTASAMSHTPPLPGRRPAPRGRGRRALRPPTASSTAPTPASTRSSPSAW
jgi:arylsulfatase A-like enzyme